MKKFKFLSKLLAVLVIVPAILLCTACGGGQLASEAKVDTRGNWEKATTVTAAEFEEFKSSLAEDKAALQKGFHITQKASAMGSKMNTNAYFVFGEDSTKNQIAMKYEVEEPAEEEGEEPTKMSYTMYAKENHLYLENLDFSMGLETERTDLKYNVDIDLSKNYSALGEEYTFLTYFFQSMLEGIDGQNGIANVIAEFEATAGDNEVVIKKIENGSTVKYQLTINAQTLKEDFGFGEVDIAVEKAEAYLIFKNGAFNGAAINMVGKVEVGETTETVEQTFAITSFEGEINFPDFKNYMGLPEVVGDIAKKTLEEVL